MGMALLLLAGCKEQPLNVDSGGTLCPQRPFSQGIGFGLEQWRSQAPFTTIACTNSFRCIRQRHQRSDVTLSATAGYSYRGSGDPHVTYRLRLVKSGRVLLSRKGTIVVRQDRIPGCGSYGGLAFITVGKDGNLSAASKQG